MQARTSSPEFKGGYNFAINNVESDYLSVEVLDKGSRTQRLGRVGIKMTEFAAKLNEVVTINIKLSSANGDGQMTVKGKYMATA